jgi:hypothetical protein
MKITTEIYEKNSLFEKVHAYDSLDFIIRLLD